MPSSTLTFGNVIDGYLTFSNIVVNELDAGDVDSFTASPVVLSPIPGATAGIQWSTFTSAVYGPDSQEQLTFDYDVTNTAVGEAITSINSLYIVDLLSGSGTSVTAVANVYDLQGNLIASQIFQTGQPNPAAVSFAQGQQQVHVTLTITETIDSTGTASSAIDLSNIQQTFGVTPTAMLGSIGDTVFLDLNGDGIQDGEPGLAGVTVQLMDSTGTTVLAQTTTNGSGQYLFDNLMAGTYTVKFGTLSGLTYTTADAGTDDAADSDADMTTGLTGPITLTAGEHNTTVDAGLKTSGSGAGATAALGDTVFIDNNNNGYQDSGDTVAVGVTVNLLDAVTGDILDSTTTDGFGHYAFTNLEAGDYKVGFVAPNGYGFVTADQGGDDARDSDANSSTGVTSTITLTAGEINDTIDAGLKAASAGLGDTVWYDVNRNGIQDANEQGIANVTVKLYSGTGTYITSTTTDSSGHYGFTDLAAGDYKVGFTASTGYKLTTANVGTDDAKDSDASTTNGMTGVIHLNAGEVNNTVDAGLQSKSGISILKVPCDNVVTSGSKVTFTYYVKNTGSTSLTNVKVVDNTGTSASPQLVNATQVLSCGYNVGDTNRDGKLSAGETWKYSSSSTEYGCGSASSGGYNYSSGCGGYSSSYNCNTYGNYNGSCGSYSGGSNSCGDDGRSGGYDQNCRYDGYGRYTFKTDDSGNHYNCYSSNYNCTAGSRSYCEANSYTAHGNYTSNCDNDGNYCGSYGGYGSYGGSSSSSYSCYSSSSYNCYSGGYDCYGGGYSSNNYGGSYGGSSYGCSYDNNYCGYGGSSYGGYSYDRYGGSYDCSYGGGWGGSSDYGCGSYGGSYGYDDNCYGGGSYGYGSSYSCYSGGWCGDGWSSGGSNCGGSTSNLGLCSAVDTATVTATSSDGLTVSDSDTKSVMVLNSNSPIAVDSYCPPTGSLKSLFGAAKVIEFKYNPSDTVSLKQVQSGMASVAGHNTNQMAFIEISDKADPFAADAHVYFEGNVKAGQQIFADATTNIFTHEKLSGNPTFSQTAGDDLYAFIFNSEADFIAGANPVQTIAYNASGSQAMHIGDKIGSLTLTGYVGTNDGYLVS